MFRRSLLPLVVVGMFVVYGYAQEANSTQDQPSTQESNQDQTTGKHDHHGWNGEQGVDRRLQHMTKALNLTSDQQAKVKTILEDQQKQFQSLRQESSLSQQDRRSKMIELHQTTASQIREVLNPDQQKKFDTMTQKHEQRMKERMGQGDGQGGSDTDKQ